MSRGKSATRPRRRLRWLLGVLPVAMLVLACAGPTFAEVTGAADNLRTGWYPDEPSLTPALLSGGSFQRVFKDHLQGQIYAQPLTANGTLLVVTEENWAYGLDPLTGAMRWEKQFGTAVEAGEAAGATIKCTDLEPRVGITGTPVIDTEHNAAYFVSNSYISGSSGQIGWYMNAIELRTGKELPKFPVQIEGEAQNLTSEKVKFEPVHQLQRPALLMMNGVVYAAFGSHCDINPYQGWIVGVNASGEVVTKWATSGHGGSIWQSGGGLVSDVSGQILFSTGNDDIEPGVWDPPEGSGKQTPEPEGKLGESVVRVEAQAGGELATRDYFSPFNSKVLDEKDLDVGSSAPVGLPSPYFGNVKVPHLLVQEGKAGTIYLLNRDGLGGRGSTSNNVVQELGGFTGFWGAAAVWPGEGGYVDFASVQGHLHFFKYGEKSGEPALIAETKSSEEFAFGSGSPIVTSNGTASGSGILWINWCPKAGCKEAEAELRAYNPAGGEGAKPVWQEKIGSAAKFSRPDASNGHIYVGNREGDIFGFSGPQLTSSSPSLELAAPVGSQATQEVTLTSTGTELEVTGVKQPSAPFEANLPAVHTKIAPGEAIKVTVRFNPASRGPANGEFGIVTQAGETKVALSGSGEESSQERAEREQHERETKEKAGSTTTGGIVTTASLITPPAGPAVTAESPPTLTKLKLRASSSRLGSHRRKVVVSYALSAAGTVEVAIFRRVISHRCQRGASTCVRWVPTTIKLRVTGHVGTNVLTLNLGRLAVGRYRLAATPIARSGTPGVTRYVHFKAV
jgi:hypothetical protein